MIPLPLPMPPPVQGSSAEVAQADRDPQHIFEYESLVEVAPGRPQ